MRANRAGLVQKKRVRNATYAWALPVLDSQKKTSIVNVFNPDTEAQADLLEQCFSGVPPTTKTSGGACDLNYGY